MSKIVVSRRGLFYAKQVPGLKTVLSKAPGLGTVAGLLLVKLLQVFKMLGAACRRVESSVGNARASGTDWDHALC